MASGVRTVGNSLRYVSQVMAARYRTFAVTALGLVLALCLGGGTKQDLISDAVLQLLFVPVFLYGIATLGWSGARTMKGTALFLCLLFLIPLLQLVPLPHAWGPQTPLHRIIADALAAIGKADAAWPLSIAPEATLKAMLALIVPVGIFLCVVQLDWAQRRHLTVLLVVGGVANALLGLVQVAQGQNSTLRFYEVTNVSEAVGFFANRNHFAALLYVVFLFSVAWLGERGRLLLSAPRRSRSDVNYLAPVFVLLFAASALLMAVLMARSRAGLILSTVALALSGLLLAKQNGGASEHFGKRHLIGLALIVGFIFSSQYLLARVLDRLADDPLQDARIVFARRTWVAAWSFFPFGSGVGTFRPAYAHFERAQDALVDTFANRAHNDLLEVFLEAGLAGVLLIAVFSIWLFRRIWQLIWRSEFGTSDLDRRLALAGALGCALVLAHSLLDYPLRTAAMMSVVAMALGLLIQPPTAATAAHTPSARSTEHGHRRRRSPEQHATSVADAPAGQTPQQQIRPAQPWSDVEDWPDAWKKGGDR